MTLQRAACLYLVAAAGVGCARRPDTSPADGAPPDARVDAADAVEGGLGQPLVDFLGNPDYPDDFWRPATGAEARVNVALLEQAVDAIQSRGWEVHSFLVARDGRLVFERYGYSGGTNPGEMPPEAHQVVPSERQPIFSVTKTVTSALVGLAIKDGFIPGVASTLPDFFPNLADLNPLPGKETITLDDLLTMRSGLTFTEGEQAVFAEPAPAEAIVSRALASAPGTTWNYSSGDAHVVSEIIRRATSESPSDYARTRLFTPIGIIDPPWDADATGTNFGGFGLSLTSRELARLGELYRNDGVWANQQVVPADWVSTATSYKCASTWGMDYGYYWFLPSLNDFFVAIGFNGQQIFVSRTYHAVIVFTGNVPSEEANTDYSGLLTSYIVPAMQ